MCCNLLKCLLSNNCLQSVEVLKGQQTFQNHLSQSSLVNQEIELSKEYIANPVEYCKPDF